MSLPPLKKILVARIDRIGDVLLSLPMVSRLKQAYPGADVLFLVRTYTQALVHGQEGISGVVLYDTEEGRKPFWSMCRELRSLKLDAVVVAYPTLRLALLLVGARIPLRIGTGYRWYSLLFNRRLYEHRKRGDKHEAEYNLALLTLLGCSPGKPSPPVFVPGAVARRTADVLLADIGVTDGERIVVLHPGSGGSSRDWPLRCFAELARGLVERKARVIVTGMKGEESLVRVVVAGLEGLAVPVVGRLSLEELGALLERAHLVVANSTGPLHLAAAVGTPVIGFYPPIPHCSSRRWGPLTDRRVIFEPKTDDCPVCRGGPCRGGTCMELIKVEDVLMSALQTLDQTRGWGGGRDSA